MDKPHPPFFKLHFEKKIKLIKSGATLRTKLQKINYKNLEQTIVKATRNSEEFTGGG